MVLLACGGRASAQEAGPPRPPATAISEPPVTIPAGTTYARYALFDADVSPGADIDLCLYQGTTLVGSSGSGTVLNLSRTTDSLGR